MRNKCIITQRLFSSNVKLHHGQCLKLSHGQFVGLLKHVTRLRSMWCPHLMTSISLLSPTILSWHPLTQAMWPSSVKPIINLVTLSHNLIPLMLLVTELIFHLILLRQLLQHFSRLQICYNRSNRILCMQPLLLLSKYDTFEIKEQIFGIWWILNAKTTKKIYLYDHWHYLPDIFLQHMGWDIVNTIWHLLCEQWMLDTLIYWTFMFFETV